MVAGEQRAYSVPPQARGERLDQHLASALPGLTRSRIKLLIDDGRVRVDGVPAKASARLRGGESVEVDIPPPPPAEARAQDIPLVLLHEDADLAVLDKPPGMVVHPAVGNWEGTVVNALLHRFGALTSPGGPSRAGLVHRLDKDTSGCLVIAKTPEALTELQASFKSRKVDKTYLAVVHGAPPESARIETLYGRHPIHRKRFTGRVHEGKSALTVYRVRERLSDATLLEVELHTGRTHQIRVHLSEAGFPLLGDALYGGGRKAKGRTVEAKEALGRQALHAWKLAFPHPRTGAWLSIEAPLPPDFERALAMLREPAPGPVTARRS